MPGLNTDTEFRKDDENHVIDSGEMSSTVPDDPSFPGKVVFAPENPTARLEDEMQNSSPPHMEMQNKRGNSVARKVIFEGDEGESCSFHLDIEDEILEKILNNSNCDDGPGTQPMKSQILSENFEMVVVNQEHDDICAEKQFDFAKENDRNHQEWTSFQQDRGEEENAVLMSNLDDLDNGLTGKDYASEAIDQNGANRNSDTAADIVKDVCNGLLNKRNVMKSLRISEKTSNLAGKKMELSKFIDSHVLQTERAISEIQHVDSGDPHLGTLRLGCLAASSPENIPPKNGASRELRRASLMLIPPHGANRLSSSFMSCELSRVRSGLFPTGAKRFLSASSAAGCTTPQTCKEQQVDCSNHLGESCTPMVEESSKSGEGSHFQTGVLENKHYHEETQSGLKNTMVGDGHFEVKSKKRPPTNNLGQQDADMTDFMPFGSIYLKNPKHELDEPQVFQNEIEVQHVDEKGIQRDFKIEAESKTNFSNPLVQSEAKVKRVNSMFKNDYKKPTSFRKFRNMNNLARISSMREGILAHRRSSCVNSASVDHICLSQKGGGEARGTAMVDHTEGNITNNQSKMKFSVFGKKRFLEKALFESVKRLQVQKMLRSGVYDGLAVPIKETEAKNNRIDNSSKEVNQTPLNIAKCESELDGERMIEQKTRRREQFKKSLKGKSTKKAKKIAERVAAFQRSKILQSKRGHTSIDSAITNMEET